MHSYAPNLLAASHGHPSEVLVLQAKWLLHCLMHKNFQQLSDARKLQE
jgi:hypothetical protein